MSIELELEDDGTIRVKVDREGERAVSDTIDPMDLIRKVADTAGLDDDDIAEKWYEEETVESGIDESGNVVSPGIDESAPPEPEEGDSAQEDDNV